MSLLQEGEGKQRSQASRAPKAPRVSWRSYLSGHPFAVDAQLERSITAVWAMPKENVRECFPELPSELELDVFQDDWAFVAVAAVQVRDLRPVFLPRCFGKSFILVGYRVFVRFTKPEGINLRGLYVLRSDTNGKSMYWMGRLLTRYGYHYDALRLKEQVESAHISSESSGFSLKASWGKETIALPEGSPFENWKEARRYSGPMPFTFSKDEASGRMLVVEGKRSDWKPQPVEVDEVSVPWLDSHDLENRGAVLANAFMVEGVPYHWKKGVFV